MSARIIERLLASQTVEDITLLDAVEAEVDGKRQVTLFFDTGVDLAQIVAPKRAKQIELRSVGGAPYVTYEVPKGALTFEFAGEPVEIKPAEAELEILEGANVLAAVRNGEDAKTVLTWLRYHVAEHSMTGAVIFDRAKPSSDKAFVKALKAGAAKLDCTVIVLSSSVPFGRTDLPAEAHPFCVAEAPGKDRMEIPPPAPWDAPLGALCYYEITRARFLEHARAVANIDVHDLMERSDISVFDLAVRAEGGLIAIFGRHCYPWRVRNNQPTLFADHICVQFDARGGRQRWCIAPSKAPEAAVWRLVRMGNVVPDPEKKMGFYRHMSLRHPSEAISKIVPKTSLIEHPPLLEKSKKFWKHNPVRMPEIKQDKVAQGRGRCAIVTTMKNEGPFILEWLAYHRAIGFDDIIVYTNDCTDGTDTMLQMLERKGICQWRENRFQEMDLKPQHAALQSAEEEDVIKNAKWATCIDVDEFVNIKVGDGTLDALFAAVPDANMISMTWRLFGNGDVQDYVDGPITEQFLRCAPEYARKPHQAWGFKTLFQNIGLFKKLGVHRPKGLNPQLWEDINWVNGSGVPLPREMYRNGWRSTIETYGYDLVQLNHYAVRSAESFLVKRDRGRVNHVDRDQGLAYWFRMNNNYEQDDSILPRLDMMKTELAKLMSDAEIAAAHEHSVKCHRAKIDELKATENYSKFFAELTSARQEKLARLHGHFGSNVFLSGPLVVPDEIVEKDPEEEWFFTVELQGETAH
ncbi:glycosyltransferase family 2 protein [Planktotalea sp.]|uniref:glycosyltransferase family 2 protein n=1 Tax=Planktotalea sp. TaxID=2029877 RepID=UPI00329723B7